MSTRFQILKKVSCMFLSTQKILNLCFLSFSVRMDLVYVHDITFFSVFKLSSGGERCFDRVVFRTSLLVVSPYHASRV